MYESFDKLKMKGKAGVKAALDEQERRKGVKQLLPLRGMDGTELYMVITEEIQGRLHSIDALYKALTPMHTAREIVLLDAFHSATIEGARTTVENVRKAYNDPRTKDDKMVVNTAKAMDYAYQHAINGENIRTMWEIIVEDVCENQHLAGEKYRSGMVYVGSLNMVIHVPAKPDEIESLLRHLGMFMLESQENVWMKAAIFHFYFVYVHPFCDGNGRAVRILTNAYLYQNGIKKIKHLSLSRSVNQKLGGYYCALKEAEIVYTNGKKWMDITPFIDYFLECVEECMVASMREEVRPGSSEAKLLKCMRKKGAGTEITRKKAAALQLHQ